MTGPMYPLSEAERTQWMFNLLTGFLAGVGIMFLVAIAGAAALTWWDKRKRRKER